MIKHQLVTSLEAGRLASTTMPAASAARRSVSIRAVQDHSQQQHGLDTDTVQSRAHEPALAR
jgi:hypothetical protein